AQFHDVIDNPHLFSQLMMYSASNFCPEITLFLEEYQELKAKVVAFFNMGEKGFDHPELDIEIPPPIPPRASSPSSIKDGSLRSLPKSSGNHEPVRPYHPHQIKTTDHAESSEVPIRRQIVATIHSKAATPISNKWVLVSSPPFSPPRITILQTLLESPAAAVTNSCLKQSSANSISINSFKVVPFALRSQFYGFYRIFIAEGGTLQINIEGRIMDQITRMVESYRYTVDMFDEVHAEVLQMLYHNIYRKFMSKLGSS
ncbi:hypothetical protein EV182_006064, partial [Spiromyces aspiralis]